MAVKTTAQAGVFNLGTTWIGGVVPVDNDSIVIDTGHRLTWNINNSAWTNGILGITIGSGATLDFDQTMRTYLKCKGNITRVDNTARILIGSEENPVLPLGDGTPETCTINFNGAFYINDVPIQAYGEVRELYDEVAAEATAGANQVVLTEGLTLRAGDSVVIENSNTANPGRTSSAYTVSAYDPGTKTVTISPVLSYNTHIGDVFAIKSNSVLIRNNAYTSGSRGLKYTDSDEILNELSGVRLYYHRNAGVEGVEYGGWYLKLKSCVFDGCYAGVYKGQWKIDDCVFYNCTMGSFDMVWDWGGAYPVQRSIPGFECGRPYYNNCIFIHCGDAISSYTNSNDYIDCKIINCLYAVYMTHGIIMIRPEIHNCSYGITGFQNSYIKDLSFEHGYYSPAFALGYGLNSIIDGISFINCNPARLMYFCGGLTIKNGQGLNEYMNDFSQFNGNCTLIDCDLIVEDDPDTEFYPDIGGNFFHIDEAYHSALTIKNYLGINGYDIVVVGSARMGIRSYEADNIPPGFSYGLMMNIGQNGWWENFIQPSYYEVPITLQYQERVQVRCMLKKPRDLDITNPVIQIVDAVFDPIIGFNRSLYTPVASVASTPGEFDWEELTLEYTNTDHIQEHKYYLRFYAADKNIIEHDPIVYMNWSIIRGFVMVDSYATLSEANEYFSYRLGSTSWSLATDDDKQKALKMATQSIDRLPLSGVKLLSTQTLQFPRKYTRIEGLTSPWGLNVMVDNQGFAYDSESVPNDVKYATCEEALALLMTQADPGDQMRLQLQAMNVKSYTLGEVSETFGGGGGGGIIGPWRVNEGLKSRVAYEFMLKYISTAGSIG